MDAATRLLIEVIRLEELDEWGGEYGPKAARLLNEIRDFLRMEDTHNECVTDV